MLRKLQEKKLKNSWKNQIVKYYDKRVQNVEKIEKKVSCLLCLKIVNK